MPERIKDQHKIHSEKLEGLTENTLNFYNELSSYYPDVRITSGKRSASQKVGKHSSHSHHNTGSAIDIGSENYEVYNFLMNTKEGLGLLNKYNFGAYDETNPDNLKKTGGTAIHVHLGQDKKLVQIASERFQNFDKGIQPVYAFITPEEKRNSDFHVSPVVGQPTSQPQTQNISQVESFQLDSAQVAPSFINVESFQRDIDKEQVKEQKIQMSSARQNIEAKKAEQEALLKMFDQISYLPPKQPAPQRQNNIPEIQLPDVQTALPNLPNLFSFQ